MQSTHGYEGFSVECARSELMPIPNLLTALRLAAGCAIAFTADYPGIALALAAIGAVTDFFDGWWARHFNCGTEFGKRFDQLTDKVFGIALMVTVIRLDGFQWFTLIPFTLILAYSVSITLLRVLGRAMESSREAKWKTGVQFASGVGIVGAWAIGSDTIWVISYIVLWASLPLMWYAWRRYMHIG